MSIDPAHLIRPARNEEANALNQLTRRSVLHWGYEPAFLEWEPEAITVDQAFMQRARVFLLEEIGALVGYYAFTGLESDLRLDKLFLEPEYIGTGRGRLLWNHAVAEARSVGAPGFTLYSDPNAAPFYAAMGARFVQEIETNWPGWRLHEFRVTL